MNLALRDARTKHFRELGESPLRIAVREAQAVDAVFLQPEERVPDGEIPCEL